MYEYSLHTTSQVRALVQRDFSWIRLCKGQVLPSYAKSSVKKCTDVLLISSLHEVTETTKLTSENIYAFCFVCNTEAAVHIDLFAAKSGYGSGMMKLLTEFSGTTPIYLNAIQSAKWFYFDVGRFAFRTTNKHHRPRIKDGCSEMYFVKEESDPILYQIYQKDRLISEHIYLHMRVVATTGEVRSTYKRMFFDVCQKLSKHFENTSVPNYIRKNMVEVKRLV